MKAKCEVGVGWRWRKKGRDNPLPPVAGRQCLPDRVLLPGPIAAGPCAINHRCHAHCHPPQFDAVHCNRLLQSAVFAASLGSSETMGSPLLLCSQPEAAKKSGASDMELASRLAGPWPIPASKRASAHILDPASLRCSCSLRLSTSLPVTWPRMSRFLSFSLSLVCFPTA